MDGNGCMASRVPGLLGVGHLWTARRCICNAGDKKKHNYEALIYRGVFIASGSLG